MRKSVKLMAMASAVALSAVLLASSQSVAQAPPPADMKTKSFYEVPPATAAQAAPVDNRAAPDLFYTVDPEPLKLPPEWNFGETLSVAVNSKGYVVVLNHPGTATSGPLYGNATTQLWLFGPDGRFLREIGKGVYGLGYAHSVRFDKDDNLWVADKGTDSVTKFNPQFRTVMNLGRRLEGFDSGQFEHPKQQDVTFIDGQFRGVSDMAFDAEGNIYVSDGYINSRVAKFTKDGDWVKTWGYSGRGGIHANENPYAFSTPHNIQVDRAGNVYVADRGNRRIQVFDRDGRFERFIYLNAPYDKARHPTLANMPADPNARPDETQPWALCITNTPTQYLYAVDSEPSRIYKMTLDGKILGKAGGSGRRVGQLNWPHGIACPKENEVWVADMNNWRIQKFNFYPSQAAADAAKAAKRRPVAAKAAAAKPAPAVAAN